MPRRTTTPLHYTASLGTEQFLKAPVLFKYGPWALFVGGILLALATVLAGQWRVVEGRKGEYEKAFCTATAVATAAAENVEVLMERLWQVSHQVGAGRTVDATARGMRVPGVDTVAFSGPSVAARHGPETADTEALARQALTSAIPHLRDAETEFVLPAVGQSAGSAGFVPVVHKLADAAGSPSYVVHLVGPAAFKRIADGALGSLQGVVQLTAADGRLLHEVGSATLPDPANVVTATNLAQAMATPLDFDSRRLLLAKATDSEKGVFIRVGLQEADVLGEFKARVSATWVIIAATVAFMMTMVGLTIFALVKFARTEAYLRSLATTDILTGLPNRRRFEALLSQAVDSFSRRREPMALFFLDLDNFKDINDALGHPAGDALLQHVGGILRRTLGDQHDVCRLGGDEFTLLVNGLSTPEQARLLSDRIFQELRTVFDYKGVEIAPQASMGVAVLPAHTTDATDLMRFADTALYHAKRHGKGCCVVYDDSMAAQAVAKASTIRDLSRAITHDELFLVYQPKYHLASGVLTGHEALVRWAHPSRGLVSPAEFIPLAEESGLINELGNWVLRRAVQQMRQWHAEGHGWHKVSVNVSPRQLRDDSFVSLVKRALVEAQVPSRCLQLEITESSLADNVEKARALLSELRRLDITIAVDDFGTGYSSLSTLSQFEIDYLKVDRSFVNVLLTKEGESICRAIVSLGHSLQMNVIAEGVETREQARALADLGCNEVQGFLYSKPQAPDVAVTLLRVDSATPAAHQSGASSSTLPSLPALRAVA